MKKSLSFVFFILIFLSCVSGPTEAKGKKRPGWLDNLNSVYPSEKFIAAIGEGDTLKEAQGNAAASLATIFKVDVEVESSLQSRYAEYSKNGIVSVSEENIMIDNITQSSDQTLMNIKYGETYTDPNGTTFAVAYLNRAETGNVYRQAIDSNAEVVRHLMDRSSEQSDLLRKYAFLDAAYVVAQNNEVLVEQLAIINPAMRKTLSTGYDLKQLKTDRSDTAENLIFVISISNDTDSRISNIVGDVLTGQGFSLGKNGNLTVRGSVGIEDVELDNGYDNKKWYLKLDVVDEKGVTVISFEKNSRSSGVSYSAAEARAFKDMEIVVKKDFLKKLNGYFDSFIEK